MHSVSDEVRYRLLKYLEAHPGASQRELARELDLSLGKVNYCLQALVTKGLLKVQNFKNSYRKSAYLYLLTPQGIEMKVSLTYRFLRIKMAEYDALAAEIERLTAEVEALGEVQPSELSWR